ncbi:MAG: hypothetical protein JWM87_726 [Candidatus Eremiobacteraeota bacterium]|nr:hypothetical protein [Candidatus Eremiobacteraeota bacterium]
MARYEPSAETVDHAISVSPYNPLAMQRIRTRKAEITARVKAGEITAQQGAKLAREFIDEMFRRRGDPKRIPIERDDTHVETDDGAFTIRWPR